MRRRLVAFGAGAAALAACAPPQRRPQAAAEPTPDLVAQREYDALAGRGEAVYAVDARHSLVVVEVRRGGTLSRYGHDHVVASRSVRGFVAPAAGRADLAVPLAELTVDEPELRTAAGLATSPSADDVAATRRNMLGPVLKVEQHGFALVRLRGVREGGGRAELRPSITLNGVVREERAQAELQAVGDEVRVAGSLVLRQSDYGIAPFSVLGGAIQVQDALTMRFRIVARRAPP